MAHQLTERANGTYEMAYIGETPWHGLGQSLVASVIVDENGNSIKREPTIEDWTEAAGMGWKIQRGVVRYATGHGQSPADYAEVPGQHVLMRSDDKKPLGIVSDRFKVVQPSQVMEFFRDLTEGAGFTLETAGTMFEGRKFWALARIGESAIITNPVDMVGGYLLLATACDGTMATTGKLTTVRVVCNNTLGFAMSEKGNGTVKASHRSTFNPEAMKDALGIARDGFGHWVKTMRALAGDSMSYSAAEQATFALLTDEDWNKSTVEKIDITKETAGFKKIMSLFNGEGKGSRLNGVAGTAWGWVNACTEYADFHVRAQSVDNRLDSAWFGNGDKLKNKAVEIATA